MDVELGASGLVRRSIERGEGAGDDWEEYRHRLAQVNPNPFLKYKSSIAWKPRRALYTVPHIPPEISAASKLSPVLHSFLQMN